jgi:tetratricopeptide (TPR) repeat protein/tRNA A-37 threonylcarbamoyl transferase component Bud32
MDENAPRENAPRIDPTSRIVADRYRVDALIGSGSTGQVFRATRLDSGAVVAIKVLHPHLCADRHATLRFRREAKVAAAVHHPNWVRGIEFGQDRDGTWFFAMELLVGHTLAVVMRDEHPIPFARIHHLFRQTLEALEAAHARGLVHRDLKPGNIIVIGDEGGGEVAKVCDFGISKSTLESDDGGDETLRAQATTDGAICGTPAYMSPEQVRGLPVDARTDIYAASVMLFEMVTGRLPFSGGTKMDVLASHLTELPPSMSGLRAELPAGLEEVVRRGLAKSRETRYETAAELREALDVVFAGRWVPQPETVVIPAGAVPTGAVPTIAALPSRRRQRVSWLGAAALAATGGWWMWHRHTEAVAAPSPALASQPTPSAPTRSQATAKHYEPPASATDTDTASAADTAFPRARSPAPVRRWRQEGPAAAPVRHPRGLDQTAQSTVLAVPASPTSATLLEEGERLIGEGRVKEACERGEEALRLEPAAPAALRFLGRCYMRTGRRGDALASYRRYLDVAPDAPDAPAIRSIVE